MTNVIKKKMKTYCVMCRKNTENLSSEIFKTKNGRLLMHSKSTDCGIKKSRFIKQQEAKGLSSKLDIKTPLIKVPILDDILF